MPTKNQKQKYNQAWWAKHKEVYNARRRQRYAENGLTDAEIAWKSEYAKEHYKQNKAFYAARSRLANAEKRRILAEIKSEQGCADCFVSDCWLLDFHHHNGDKTMNISSNIGSKGIERLLDEAAKCIVLCANCHRTRHHKEKNNEH